MSKIEIAHGPDWIEVTVGDGEPIFAGHALNRGNWVLLLRKLGHEVTERELTATEMAAGRPVIYRL
jgi:hypothetical protein